jgi:DegV family protein with EDD domain
MTTIVTDSSVCIKRRETEDLGIKIIPTAYYANDRLYFESMSDENGNFEPVLRERCKFSTAHPNPSSFLSCFEEELAKGNDILCITISSRLSGAYSAAHLAAKQAADERIAVVDSHLTGGGLHLLAKEARRMLEAGVGKTELIDSLLEKRANIRTAFTVDDITPLRNSGRIGLVRLGITTMLNIKPILLLKDGIVVSGCAARGKASTIKALTRDIPNDASELAVDYIGNSRLAADICHILRQRHPNTPMSLHKLGPVLAIHLGLNTVAVTFARYPQPLSQEGS